MKTSVKTVPTEEFSFDKEYNHDTLAQVFEMEREEFDNMISLQLQNHEVIDGIFTSAALKKIYGIYCNERYWTPNYIHVVCETKTSLARKLEIGTRKFNKMIEPHLSDIGERNGYFYNLHQVRMILGVYYMAEQKKKVAEKAAA